MEPRGGSVLPGLLGAHLIILERAINPVTYFVNTQAFVLHHLIE